MEGSRFSATGHGISGLAAGEVSRCRFLFDWSELKEVSFVSLRDNQGVAIGDREAVRERSGQVVLLGDFALLDSLAEWTVHWFSSRTERSKFSPNRKH